MYIDNPAVDHSCACLSILLYVTLAGHKDTEKKRHPAHHTQHDWLTISQLSFHDSLFFSGIISDAHVQKSIGSTSNRMFIPGVSKCHRYCYCSKPSIGLDQLLSVCVVAEQKQNLSKGPGSPRSHMNHLKVKAPSTHMGTSY